MNELNVFIDSNEGWYPSFDLSIETKKLVDTIIKEDSWFKNNNSTKEIYCSSQRIIKIEESFVLLTIYYVPKHWDIVDLNLKQEECCVQFSNKLNAFYEEIEEINKRHNIRDLNTQNKTNNIENTISIEKELYSLKQILQTIKKKSYSVEEYVVSDKLIGELVYDLNIYHNHKSSKIQMIQTEAVEVYELINSFLNYRFNNDFILFLETIKNKVKKAYELLSVLSEIKRRTKYHKQKRFLNQKSRLRKAAYDKIRKLDKNLYKLVLRLLDMNEYSNERSVLRKALNVTTAWESYLKEEYYNTAELKPRKVYIDSIGFEKSSNPDLLLEDRVIDAKYKTLGSLEYIKSDEINDSDLDKLLRDMFCFEKEIGELIYPSKKIFSFKEGELLVETEKPESVSKEIKLPSWYSEVDTIKELNIRKMNFI